MRRVLARMTCMVLAAGCLLATTGCGWLTAIFAVSPASGFPPLEVAFDASQSTVGTGGPIAEYLWEFGDGETAEGKASAHTYGSAGTYKVTLTVFDTAGWRDKQSKRVVVLQTPVARFTHTPGADPLSIVLDGSDSEPSPAGLTLWDLDGAEPQEIVEYEWSFGDGATASGSGNPGVSVGGIALFGDPVQHTYATPGTYEITLVVKCNYGYTAQTTQTVVVGENEDPELDLKQNFAIVSSSWEEADDEEETEQGCIEVWGTVRNGGTIAAGCEITATAFDALGNPVGSTTYWPAGVTNIAPSAITAFAFSHCQLTVLPGQVERVDLLITDATVW